MGTVTIKSMRFQAKHGVLPHEKRDGNTFEVDVIAEIDIVLAGESDDLAKTFDYSRAHAIAEQVMDGASVDLIETLALRIGGGILAESIGITELTVAVRKLNPPIGRDAAYSEVRHTWRM